MSETLTMAKALNLGLRRCLEDDDKTLIMGEDIGKLGGVFRVTDALQKDFGEHRVIDTPLAESAIVGTAVGLAMRGYRPVVEIQFDGFVYPAFDQIVSQLAKMHARSAGQVRLPIVIRIPYGGGIGAVEHHSESPEAYFAHTAGLRVVSPSQPGRRLLDAAAGDRVRRPGDLLRAEAALLGQGRGRRVGRARDPAVRRRGWPGRARTSRSPATARWCAPAWRPRRPPRPRVAASRCSTCGRCHRSTSTSSARRCERTGRLVVVHEAPVWLGPRRGDRRPGAGALLLLPRGAGAAGRRLPRAVPAVAASRSTTCPTSTGCWTPSTGSMEH